MRRSRRCIAQIRQYLALDRDPREIPKYLRKHERKSRAGTPREKENPPKQRRPTNASPRCARLGEAGTNRLCSKAMKGRALAFISSPPPPAPRRATTTVQLVSLVGPRPAARRLRRTQRRRRPPGGAGVGVQKRSVRCGSEDRSGQWSAIRAQGSVATPIIVLRQRCC